MFISKREYFVEVRAILQEGVDFTESDLEPNVLVGDKLLELSSAARGRIAYNLGYLSMHWAGHYDPEAKTIECSLRNPLYIDSVTGQVMNRKVKDSE